MTSWALWIRAETEDEAAAEGREWADAEPNLTFEGVLSVEPREFYGVWTVTVAASQTVDQPTLGLA